MRHLLAVATILTMSMATTPPVMGAQATAIARAIQRHQSLFRDSLALDECSARRVLGVPGADSLRVQVTSQERITWLLCTAERDTALVGMRTDTELQLERVRELDGQVEVTFRAFRFHASHRERYVVDAGQAGAWIREVTADQFAQFTPGRRGARSAAARDDDTARVAFARDSALVRVLATTILDDARARDGDADTASTALMVRATDWPREAERRLSSIVRRSVGVRDDTAVARRRRSVVFGPVVIAGDSARVHITTGFHARCEYDGSWQGSHSGYAYLFVRREGHWTYESRTRAGRGHTAGCSRPGSRPGRR